MEPPPRDRAICDYPALKSGSPVAPPMKPRTGSKETGPEHTITIAFHPFSADLVRPMVRWELGNVSQNRPSDQATLIWVKPVSRCFGMLSVVCTSRAGAFR